MTANSFDVNVANIRARSENERVELDKLKLAWEIVQKERRSDPANIDHALDNLRKAYHHINATLGAKPA
jgi:hypothetical protein